MADDADLAEAIRRLQAADALGNQVGLTTPEGNVFDTVTNESLPPATTYDPERPDVNVWRPVETPRIAEGGASGSWTQPGPVPSPLPELSTDLPIDPFDRRWTQSEELRSPPPRAELVQAPNVSVSMASRDMVEHPPPRATLVDPDPDEQYFNDPDLGAAVKRAQLVDPDPDSQYLPPGQEDNPEAQNAAQVGQAVKRAALVDPDPDQAYLDAANELSKPPGAQAPNLAPVLKGISKGIQAPQPTQKKSPDQVSVTTAPSISPSAVSAPSLNLTYDSETDQFPGFPAPQQPTGKAAPSLERARLPIAEELKNPLVRQRLIASVMAEVGDQGPEARLAYLESVMNRSLARGQSLLDTINDTHYYPDSTISRLGRVYTGTVRAGIDKQIGDALNGSNISGYATGNESGNVHSGGAPVVYNPGTGERFVVENQDKDWAAQIRSAGKAPAPAGGLFSPSALGFDLGPAAEPGQLKAAQAADQANQQKQWGVLQGIVTTQDKTPGEMVDILSKPIDGVNDAMRQNFLKQYKAEITSEAQIRYGIKNPAQAYNKAISSPDFGTVAGEIVNKVGPYLNQAVTAFNQSAAQIDQNRLDYLARTLHPDATPEGRRAFIDSITSISDPAQRAITINKLIGDYAASDPQNPALGTLDAGSIADSASRLADPVFQQRQKDEIARQVDANTKALEAASDPRLRGTGVGFVADQLAQLPKNMVEALSGPIGANLMLSEIYQQTVDRIKHDNPGISDDDAKAKATASTAAQFIPAEILQRLTGGLLGGVTRGIENTATRIATSALVHSASGGSVGAAQQIASNLAEGRPMFEGVGPAAVAGAVQAAPGGVIGGLHEAPERAPVEPVRPPVAEQPAAPPERQPVTAAGVLGPEVSETVPWYKPGPLVTRAIERETFSPQELQRQIGELQEQGWTPDQIQEAIESLRPEPDFTQRGVYLSDENVPAMPTREDTARVAYEIGQQRERNGQPGNSLNDLRQAQEELIRDPTLTVTQGESEPWVSSIANRFATKRVAAGELGEIIPGEGYSTDGLVARGLRMGPEQINQHVSDLMNNRGGDPIQQAAAVRAEEARLSQRSNAASRVAEADPQNLDARVAADNAFKDLTDFHNGPVAKLKNNWHAQGMSMQGEVPLDLSTYNGLREAFLREVGKPPDPSMEPLLRKTARQVSDAAQADQVAMSNLGAQIEKLSARMKLPSDEQVRNEIMDIMKVEPCPT